MKFLFINNAPIIIAELVDATDSKSVELRFMSVRVGLGYQTSKKSN